MPTRENTPRWLLVMLMLLACVPMAHAVIMVLTPLRTVLDTSQFIVVGVVDKFYPEKPAMLLKVTEDLKGKLPTRELPMLLKGDEEAEKGKQIPLLLKRLGPDLPVILFLNKRGMNFTGLGFTNGTWFSLTGQQTDDTRVILNLTHAEPYLRRTFKGTTDEMKDVVVGATIGKTKPPEYDAKEPPGYGPELPAKKSASLLHRRGALFGVIPTIGLGGPLALLAILFPALFGGVFVLFRRWTAFITVLSINSTLTLVYWLAGPQLRGTWLGNPYAQWTLMSAVILFGVLWAWRRHLTYLTDPAEMPAPRKTEFLVLLFMTITSAASLVLLWYLSDSRVGVKTDLAWMLMLMLTLGMAAAFLYNAWRHFTGSTIPLATEGVLLGVALLGHLGYAGYRWNADSGYAGRAEEGSQASFRVESLWTYQTDDPGVVLATLCIDGDRIYAAAAHPSPTLKLSTLACLDRATGKKIWDSIDTLPDLKEMISSPVLADGRLYFGEGFHDDANCRFFCVDAASGKKIWDYQTTSQTESTPALAHGRVFFGAGNEGVLCLDAATGKKLHWRYPDNPKQGRLFRVGSGILVDGKRVFFGSGVARNQPQDKGETALVSLDADTGKLLWKVPADYPCWSQPILFDKKLYVTLGNGDIVQDALAPEKPGGQVLCLDPDTGKEHWRFDLPNGVIEKPAVDADHVYVGCRDMQVYCLGRFDGKERWRRFLESPVIAAPVPVKASDSDLTRSVIVTATGGKVAALHPHDGGAQWTYSLAGDTFDQRPHLSSTPRVVTTSTETEERRRIYFGGGPYDMNSRKAAVHCLEDVVKLK
jgi:outer membrane protein assembly factor BamB